MFSAHKYFPQFDTNQVRGPRTDSVEVFQRTDPRPRNTLRGGRRDASQGDTERGVPTTTIQLQTGQ